MSTMTLPSLPRQRWRRALLLLAAACVARSSLADDGANVAKGMLGGGMLGAEAVMMTESAFRLRSGWLYVAGGAAGAGVGAYLGHELSDDGNNRPPSFLLAGGIALIIPTVMGVMTATQYEPYEPLRSEDSDGDDAGDGDAAGASRGSDRARLDAPSFGLAQTFSREDLARFRVQQVTELHLTLLRGVF